ncbi:Odorant receptor 364 [Nylanderia fulva]|uniref:Odorant receptor 364 n=1 Tax=Nylanderia fulva TaxID=613905 RepID=A0A6G1LQC1_9HYME|nr:Odorant receptor 364 [Nylanderia fulva]
MSTDRWNDDIAYVFSIHTIFLRIYGMWPLQTQTLFTRIRWGFCLIALITIIPYVMLDLISSNQNADINLEAILFVVGVMVVIMTHLCIGLRQKKQNININGAIDDWLFVKDDKKTRKIMKEYAYKARVLTLMLLFDRWICFCLRICTNTTNWILPIPCDPLSKSITGSQYRFANKTNTDANYRKKFIGLINRHSKLIEFYQNLKSFFNRCTLINLVTVIIMLAFIGLRIIWCLMENNYIEVAKNALDVFFYLIESLIRTYGGDLLQRESEGIFYAIYATFWFTLPLTLMKDMHFAIMKSSIPFRVTGGKFFYVNRETMMNIPKITYFYISVLRIALLTK